MADGTFWVLTDNGAGSKANSPDFMLYLNHYKVDFQSGKFQRTATVFLHDPDKKVPFRIVHEGTGQRYLTSSDFDTETSSSPAAHCGSATNSGLPDRADLKGKVLAVYDTLVDGKAVRSPDHPAVTTPGVPGGAVDFGSSVPRASKAWPRRPTAAACTRCWKGRCGGRRQGL